MPAIKQRLLGLWSVLRCLAQRPSEFSVTGPPFVHPIRLIDPARGWRYTRADVDSREDS
jgi:hypothetical protein